MKVSRCRKYYDALGVELLLLCLDDKSVNGTVPVAAARMLHKHAELHSSLTMHEVSV